MSNNAVLSFSPSLSGWKPGVQPSPLQAAEGDQDLVNVFTCELSRAKVGTILSMGVIFSPRPNFKPARDSDFREVAKKSYLSALHWFYCQPLLGRDENR